jgi:hypothetical protein
MFCLRAEAWLFFLDLFYAIPNTACHLVFIVLNTLSHKQKSYVARELISREEKKIKKPSLHKNHEKKNKMIGG